MGDFSVRKASSVFRKLQVKNGNILLVKRSVVSEGDDLDKLRAALGHLGLNALVLVVDNMDDVKSLDEGMMRKLGWVRIDAERIRNIRETISRAQKEAKQKADDKV